MNNEEHTEVTDHELLEEAKNSRIAAWLDTAQIGFMIGIILYSVAKNSWGIVTLIPVAYIYILQKKCRSKKEM